MNKEPRTMQAADAVTASRAPENTPAMVKKIGKTTYKVHVHFSNTSTETMSDKIKRIYFQPRLAITEGKCRSIISRKAMRLLFLMKILIKYSLF